MAEVCLCTDRKVRSLRSSLTAQRIRGQAEIHEIVEEGKKEAKEREEGKLVERLGSKFSSMLPVGEEGFSRCPGHPGKYPNSLRSPSGQEHGDSWPDRAAFGIGGAYE